MCVYVYVCAARLDSRTMTGVLKDMTDIEEVMKMVVCMCVYMYVPRGWIRGR
jgi:hypothetical protein